MQSELILSPSMNGIEKLVLWNRFQPAYIQKVFIPEIEANCQRYHCDAELVSHFQRCKMAHNSMYFHHAYSDADIPIGTEYNSIGYYTVSRTPDGLPQVVLSSIQPCRAKVLCFFTNFRIIPIETSSRGHHENSLIQFQDGIPDLVYDLREFTEESREIETTTEICLFNHP